MLNDKYQSLIGGYSAGALMGRVYYPDIKLAIGSGEILSSQPLKYATLIQPKAQEAPKTDITQYAHEDLFSHFENNTLDEYQFMAGFWLGNGGE